MSKPLTMTMEAQVEMCLARHRMLDGVRRLGVAVSGGSDSVALLRLLIPLCRAAGVTPVVLHLDHGLRGAVSAADARFVARLAKRRGVEHHVGQLVCGTVGRPDGETCLPPAGQSMEMAARTARQLFFREAEKQHRLDAIATGHTADDVAETLLLRLARGSGATGLSGLRPLHTVAGVRYVRPLLECKHEALRAWLRTKRQAWREDASNCDERIPRNRLRHTVLPWLEQNWSLSIRAMLAQSAAILRDEDALLEELSAECGGRNAGFRMRNAECGVRSGAARSQKSNDACQPSMRVSSSSRAPHSALRIPHSSMPVALQRRVLRRWLLSAGHPPAAGWEEVEGIRTRLGEKQAWQVSLPGGVLVRGARGKLELVPATIGRTDETDRTDETELPVPGRADMAGIRVTTRFAKGIVRTRGPVGVFPSACSLDAEALRGKTLLVRTRRPGDRIRPLGLDGSKMLQDLFVDAKVPAEQRDHLPLLVVDGEVVWVPGYRVAKALAVRGLRAAAVRVEMKAVGRCGERQHAEPGMPNPEGKTRIETRNMYMTA